MYKHPSSLIHSNKLPNPADKITSVFVDKICAIRDDFIEGIYLTGSLPLNDFYSNKSDIDFLVLCKHFPDEKIVLRLKEIHNSIARKYPGTPLSGCYITRENIQSDKPEKTRVLCYHEKSMTYQDFEMAPVSLSELQTNSYILFGLAPGSLAINMSREKLNGFLHHNINSYWAKWIRRHSSFFNRKILLLAFPRLTEWVLLGIARQLHTLRTGEIISKTAAGTYCLEWLPERFHPVIKEAIEIRKDKGTYPLLKSYGINPSFKRMDQTIECARYMVARFNEFPIISEKI